MPPVSSFVDVEPVSTAYKSELFSAADNAAPPMARGAMLNPSAALAAADIDRQRRAVDQTRFQSDMQAALDVRLKEQAQEDAQRRQAMQQAQERAAQMPEIPADTTIMSPAQWAQANFPQYAQSKYLPQQVIEMLNQGYGTYLAIAKQHDAQATRRFGMEIDQQGAWQRRATAMEAGELAREKLAAKEGDDTPNTIEAAAVRDIMAGKTEKDSPAIEAYWRGKGISGANAKRATEMLADVLATVQMEDVQKELAGVDRSTPEGRAQAAEIVRKYSGKEGAKGTETKPVVTGNALQDQVFGDPVLGGGIMGSLKEGKNPASGPVRGFVAAFEQFKQLTPGMDPAQADQVRGMLLARSEGLETRVAAMVKSGELGRAEADAVLAALFELRTGTKPPPSAPVEETKPARRYPMLGGM